MINELKAYHDIIKHSALELYPEEKRFYAAAVSLAKMMETERAGTAKSISFKDAFVLSKLTCASEYLLMYILQECFPRSIVKHHPIAGSPFDVSMVLDGKTYYFDAKLIGSKTKTVSQTGAESEALATGTWKEPKFNTFSSVVVTQNVDALIYVVFRTIDDADPLNVKIEGMFYAKHAEWIDSFYGPKNGKYVYQDKLDWINR